MADNTFNEKFIRDVARDQGVDLDGYSREQVRAMHDAILKNCHNASGQAYYDAAKEYFQD